MIAMLLTVLFVAAAGFALLAIGSTLHRYGGQALALRDELAATAPSRGFSYNVIEHRLLRGDVNVVILPVRKAAYRWPVAAGLRAAA